MFKKILSIGLSVIMVASVAICTTGCGEKKTTLKWATLFAGQSDEDKVLEVANERLETLLPGVTLEFVELNPDRWTQQLAAGEVIDIAWTGYQLDMESEINTGSYLPLNDLITEEDTPNLYKEWQEYASDYETATKDGVLYAIPNQQPIIAETSYLKIPEPLMQYFDVQAFHAATYASPTTTREVYEVLDDYLEKIWEANAVDTDLVSSGIDIEHLYQTFALRGLGAVDSDGLIRYELFNATEETPGLTSLYETEQYKLFLEYAAKWYKAGYINENILVSAGAAGSRISPLSSNNKGTFYGLTDPENGITEVYDSEGYLEQYYVNVEPDDYSHQLNTGRKLGAEQTYLAIPYTCKNPEVAIQLIELLRSPIGTEGNDLLNLLVYGFEENSEEAKEYGTYHYTLDGEDLALGNGYTVQPAASAPYGKPHWVMGNVFLTYRTTNILEGQKEYAKTYDTETVPNLEKSLFCGFWANLDDFSSQLGNVNAVTEEYATRLRYGVDGDNYMTTYDAFLTKLNQAGYQELKDEVQKQAQEFLAAK